MSDENTTVDTEAAKAEAARKKAEAIAKREAKAKEREEKKAAREQAKIDAKAAKAAAKQAEKEAKAAAKAAAKAERKKSTQPEQNGIRRPKDGTLCGRAWAIFDQVSAKNGSPASIGESMAIAKAESLNEANVRAEYARWRKFHGISGRIEAPKAEPVAA
jgi:ATPase subunit of ABC transporter with duplicated ATPase domains